MSNTGYIQGVVLREVVDGDGDVCRPFVAVESIATISVGSPQDLTQDELFDLACTYLETREDMDVSLAKLDEVVVTP